MYRRCGSDGLKEAFEIWTRRIEERSALSKKKGEKKRRSTHIVPSFTSLDEG